MKPSQLNHIHVFGFGLFVGISLGLLVLYLLKETPRVVYDYMNFKKPDQMYQDNAGICYQYKKVDVECPDPENTTKEYSLLQ